jgi:hypothetical protein
LSSEDLASNVMAEVADLTRGERPSLLLVQYSYQQRQLNVIQNYTELQLCLRDGG